MATRPRQPKRSSTDRDIPRGKLEAIARRQGGFGYSLTPHALFRFRKQLGLGGLDLLVLLAILSHASAKSTDFACASYEQLAKDTGLNRKTVINHVNVLRRKLKLLTSTSYQKTAKTNTTNVYNVQLLAEKLKTLEAKEPERGREEADDFDALMRELVAEVGLDEPTDAEAEPGTRSRGVARRLKEDDEAKPDQGDGGPDAARRRSRTASKEESAPSSQKAASSGPWRPGSSRLRPEELDDSDRAQLAKGERLMHASGRELTIDEHLYRMRELHSYSRHEIAMLLMDLRFPDADISAAMNANPLEHFARLAGAPSPAPVAERQSEEPAALPMPPDIANDPVAREAWEVVERIRLRRLNEARSKDGKA